MLTGFLSARSPRVNGPIAATAVVALSASLLYLPSVNESVAGANGISAPIGAVLATEAELTAPDAVSAQVEARARGWRIEVLDARTEDSTTWANPDSTFTSDTNSGPIRVKDESSSSGWRDLDYDLERKQDGSVGPKSGYVDLRLSGGADEAEVSRDGLVSVTTSRGKEIAFGWDEALPEPVLDGDTATYEDVRDGIDLVIQLTASGFEQFFILNERPESGTNLDLSVPLHTGHLNANELSDGSIEITDSDNRTAGYIATPYIWDSGEGSVSGLNENRVELDMDLEQIGNTQELVLTPDPGFLLDPSTEYPVVIDPSLTLQTKYDTYVRSDFPTTHYNTDDELQIGTYNGGASKARSTIDFSSTVWKGSDIVSASLKLYLFHSYSCTESAIKIYRSAKAYSGTDWGNQPYINTDYQTSYSAAKGYSSSCAAGYVTVPVTAITQSLAGNEDTTVAYGLRASETSNTGWKRFRSGDATTGKPTLSVTYNKYPNTAQSPAVVDAPVESVIAYSPTLTPKLQAKVADADGNKTRAKFELSLSRDFASIAAGCTTAYVASGTTATCAVTPALVNNTHYYARAIAYDGSLYSKSWSELFGIRGSASAPPAPVLDCGSYTNGSWTESIPTNEVTCAIAVGSSGGYSSAIKLSVVTDGGRPVTYSFARGSGKTASVIVPALEGEHVITATATSSSGKVTTTDHKFGLGSAVLVSPSTSLEATDVVQLSALGPPSGGQTVTARLQWRQANAESAVWNVGPSLPLDAGSTSDPVAVTNYGWSTAAVIADVSSGTSKTIDSKIPTLFEVQVCFSYASVRTLCTFDPTAPARVLRTPHAFGEQYAVDDAAEGAVSLLTGELKVTSADVKFPSTMGNLTLTRSHLSGGESSTQQPGMFGPAWAGSISGPSGIGTSRIVDTTAINGLMSLVGPDGDTVSFQHSSREVVQAPLGTYTEVLSDPSLASTLTLQANAGAHQISLREGDQETRWQYVDENMPDRGWRLVSSGALSNPTRFVADPAGRIITVISPAPTGIECDESGSTAGCSYLTLDYTPDTSLYVAGSGSYPGRLASVSARSFDALATDSGNQLEPQMASSMLMKYEYNASGQLVSVKDVSDPTLITGSSYEYSSTLPNARLTTSSSSGIAPTSYIYDDSSSPRIAAFEHGDPNGGSTSYQTRSYVYELPVSIQGGPDLSSSRVDIWGQTRNPTTATAVFGATRNIDGSTPSALSSCIAPGSPTCDLTYGTLFYSDPAGYLVNTAKYGAGQWILTAQDFDEQGEMRLSLSNAEISKYVEFASKGLEFEESIDLVTERYMPSSEGSDGSGRVAGDTFVMDEWSGPSALKLGGVDRFVRTHTRYEYDRGSPGAKPNGDAYMLPTRVTVGISDADNYSTIATSPLEPDLKIVSDTVYGYAKSGSTRAGWDLGIPTTTTRVLPGSAPDVTTESEYDSEGNEVSHINTSTSSAERSRQKVAYSPGANSDLPACGHKPEWAGLPCFFGDLENAETSGAMASYRVVKYDHLLQPAQIVESAVTGSTSPKRTTTMAYYADGRPKSKTVVMSGGSGLGAVPVVTYLYDALSKRPLGNSTTATNQATLQSRWTLDLWGRRTAYHDSLGVTSFTYTSPGSDGGGQLASSTNAAGTKTFTYDGLDADSKWERRGLTTRFEATGGITFRGAYDSEGRLVRQTLPGGMSQELNYTDAGQVKDMVLLGTVAGDVLPAPWLSYSREFDLDGKVIADTTPLGTLDDANGGVTDAFDYDAAGRLQESRRLVPDGEGSLVCKKSVYEFDGFGNRVRETISTTADCSDSGNVTTSYLYDDESRQQTGGNGSGTYVYDWLGRQTQIPAADLTSNAAAQIAYFDNDFVQTISQGAVETSFEQDSAGRMFKETTTSGSAQTTISRHYSGEGDIPDSVLQENGAASTTERTIPSLGAGANVTISVGTRTEKVLVLSDLQGTAVAAIPIPTSGPATEIRGYANFGEFGVSSSGQTPSAGSSGWRASEQKTVTGAALIVMGRRLYNPKTGRFTSTDPIEGGTENPYVYPPDPINESDPSGMGRVSHLIEGYHYVYKNKVGKSSKYGTASSAIKVFRKYPKEIFPFKVSNCPTLKTGNVCTLLVHGYYGDVEVANGYNSMQFTVVSDEYFDSPGSTIKFTTYVNKEWNLALMQKGDAIKTIGLAYIGWKTGRIRQEWKDQTANFRKTILKYKK